MYGPISHSKKEWLMTVVNNRFWNLQSVGLNTESLNVLSTNEIFFVQESSTFLQYTEEETNKTIV